MGSDVSLAHGVTVMSTTHTYDSLEQPIKYKPLLEVKTHIADNVWIGAKATIVAGVHLRQGSVVRAGSVVTRDVPDDSVVAGVPGRIIRNRTQP